MELKHFKFWCYKVLPLVYDDSLSYYEVLCKVVKYINNIIDDNKAQGDAIESLKTAIDEINKWRDEFGTKGLEELIKSYLAKMIFVSISNAGYIIYHVPDSWDSIEFNTTGLDISNDELSGNGHVANYDYGHLVLSY